MKKIIIPFLVFIVISAGTLLAKDIDLDSIYVKIRSPFYGRLVDKKLEAYQIIGSRLVDREVIYADWVSGTEIIYIKEYSEINSVFLFNKIKDKTTELVRFKGIVTYAKKSASGRYLFIKTMTVINNRPEGKTLQLHIPSSKLTVISTKGAFLDFALSPDGNSILYEEKGGIVELFPDSGLKKLIIRKSEYSDMGGSQQTIAYMSPNRKKCLLVSGGAGLYSAKLLSQGASRKIQGITSSSEIFWVDNTSLIYRKGDPGNYSVLVADTRNFSERYLVQNSLNTNITYSIHPKMAALLKDQLIHFYDFRENRILRTPIEGEDIFFSPDGNYFTSLLYRRLFISSVSGLKRKNIELKTLSGDIARLYQELANASSSWENDYSGDYIRRKMKIYKELAGK